MVGVMDQDMKSYSLDARLGHKEFTSGPFKATKRVTTQHDNACYQTESAIAQKNDHGFVACLWVLLTGSSADFQSPKVDGMMLRA